MVAVHWLAVHWIVFPWLAFCHLGAVGVAAVWTGTLLSAATQGSVVTILLVGASMAVLAYLSDLLVVELGVHCPQLLDRGEAHLPY